MSMPQNFRTLMHAFGLGTIGFSAGYAMALITPTGAALTILHFLPLCLTLVLLLFATIIFAVKGNPWIKRHGETLLIAIGLITLGFLLSAKWQTLLSSGVIFAGLLPNSDAAGYFAGALHFLEHGELTGWSTRRPLSTLYLASLLEFSGGSLQHALFTLTAFSAGAILTVIAVLGRSIGLGASAVAATVLVPFYFPTVGSVMSENIGLILGAAVLHSCGLQSTIPTGAKYHSLPSALVLWGWVLSPVPAPCLSCHC